jgi:peptidyl-dipeptidase A
MAGVLLSAVMSSAPVAKKAPTVAEAKAFVDGAEAKLMALAVDASRNAWIQNTYITHDSEVLAAQANERLIAAGVDYAKKATRFDKLRLPEETARKLRLLKLGLTLAAPSDPKESEEVTRLGVEMESEYGKGKYCPPGKDCLDIQAIEKVLAESRDASQLLDVWRGWHAISVPMRPKYQRFVELANKGARELGFTDSGAIWRSNYDLAPVALA